MSTEYGFKKIGDVDLIEAVSDSANVIIEDAGTLKKMAAKSIGAVKTVNGAAPDEDGNVQIQAGVQPDWNQNDDAAVDFVKNRTHYDVGEDVEIELLPATDIEFENQNGMYVGGCEISFIIEEGCQYAITIDGEKYIETATAFPFDDSVLTLGESYMKAMLKSEGLPIELTKPFVFMCMDSGIDMMMLESTETIHSISIAKIEVYEHKVMYDKTGVEFIFSNSGWSNILDTDAPVPGVEYTIVYDGTTYTCQSVSDSNGIVIIIEPEDASFTIQYVYMYGMCSFVDNVTPVESQKVVNISIDKILEDGSTEVLVTATDYTLTLSETDNAYYHSYTASADGPFEVGTTYKITCDGTEYTCTCYDANGVITLGNMTIYAASAESYENTGEPFVFTYVAGTGVKYAFKYNPPEVTHDIKITGYTKNIKKLDKKYLPDHEHEVPAASDSQIGGVKVCNTKSGLSANGNFSKIYLNTDDNAIYAESPQVQMSMTDLTAGQSYLASGSIYIVYE